MVFKPPVRQSPHYSTTSHDRCCTVTSVTNSSSLWCLRVYLVQCQWTTYSIHKLKQLQPFSYSSYQTRCSSKGGRTSTGLSARYYMNLNVKFVFQNICYKRSKWPCLSHFSNFGAEPLDVLLWSDQAFALRTLVIDARCLHQSLWSALIQTVRSRHLKAVLVGN